MRTEITLYSEASTAVRPGQGDSNSFDVEMVARQGSVLSPLLFAIVIDFTFTYLVVLVDRWGDTDDLATSSLHSTRLSVFLMAAFLIVIDIVTK